MTRSFEEEILDQPGLPPEVIERAHRGLSRAHFLLRNHEAILRVLKNDDKPVGRVLDIGCGHGELLKKVQRRLGAEVVGVDLQPPENLQKRLPIVKRDAVRDELPRADVAVCVCMAHHLHDDEFAAMIENVGRTCRRFIILDLVRHPVPLGLFTVFAPLCLPRVNVLDGRQSIRRAYTTEEFGALIVRTVAKIGGTVQHSVAPLWIRQMADIRYRTPGNPPVI